MAATPATKKLDSAKVIYQVHTYHHDPASEGYGLEAAEALGVAPERVFKTLLAAVDGVRAPAVVCIVPVTGKLDLKALAAAMDAKRATMAPPDHAQRLTGYVLGGISPLGQKRSLPTVVDASAITFETINVSGGRRGMEIELDPADLVRLTGATVAPITAL